MLSIERYWELFPGSAGDPRWGAAHVRWALILVVAIVVLVRLSQDPARRSRITHRGRRPRMQRVVERAVRAPVGGKP